MRAGRINDDRGISVFEQNVPVGADDDHKNKNDIPGRLAWLGGDHRQQPQYSSLNENSSGSGERLRINQNHYLNQIEIAISYRHWC
jgi:hypothetical protein